ncbi:MAG: peptidoglycan DD-metalloendopeptidase family protein [Gammaproteobacteria bacterium]|nr:peptidoglycan DD-metalloendopeptidase family protein [Gammaproteobacteria bacterium]
MVLLVLSGCAAHVVNAPVSSRNTQSEPNAQVAPRPGGSPRQPAGHAGEHYVVRPGDTLYSIAWQHGLEVHRLAALNSIRPPYTIYKGQRLRVAGTIARGAPLAQRQSILTRPLPKSGAVPPKPVVTAKQKPVPPPVKQASKPEPAASAAQKKSAYDGKWVWPTRGRVVRGFQKKGTGKKGIDIGGHQGQPVRAAANGKIVYVGSGLVGYGRLIIVKHNENLLSAYGHNSKLLVAEGDHVTAGQMIAKMGNSGTDRTALYFEIRKDGKPVNPMQYLPRI